MSRSLLPEGTRLSRCPASYGKRKEKNVSKIKIIHDPDEEQLEKLGVRDWPIWEKEVSEFPWSYDTSETCYILEGDVVVTPTDGEPVKIREHDLVVFPSGMSCTWKVRKAVRKHYKFE
jgi:uncharacterized cupin superfamily protein